MKSIAIRLTTVLTIILLMAVFPSFSGAKEKFIKFGVIAPMSGPAAGWGIPIKRGFEVFADDVNARGGIKIGEETYKIQPLVYDDKGFIPAESLKAVKKGLLQDGTKYFLGTPTTAVVEAVMPFLAQHDALLLTWGAGGGIRPEWPNLIGTNVAWPQFHTVNMQSAAKRHPNIKRVAITQEESPWAPDDKLWAELACEAAGFEIVYSGFHPGDTIDWNPLLTTMLAKKPDLIFLGACPPATMPHILAAGRNLGYTGFWYSDNWKIDEITAKVPIEYLNGCIGPKPDFDDPAVGETVNRLHAEYLRRWPGEWSGDAFASWPSYSVIVQGMKLAQSIEPIAVRKALKSMKAIEHPLLGKSRWGGKEIYGVDNFLMTPVYCGEITDGKFHVVDILPFADWYETNKDLVIKRYKETGRLRK